MFRICRLAFCVGIGAVILLLGASVAFAGWETGAKVGFDTDVSRSISGGESDEYLQGYVAYSREPSGETRLDWSFSVAGEAVAFASLSDLDYAAATFSPGLVYFYRPGWILSAAPFLQGKEARDSNQSALAIGGKLLSRHRLSSDFYAGEYYVFTDSRANADTFSFTEHAVGVLLGRTWTLTIDTSDTRARRRPTGASDLRGRTWTRTVNTEIGYEYSRGDSFRSVGTSPLPPGGMGGFSSAFGAEVVRERVDRHAIGVSAGIDWTKTIFSAAGYKFTSRRGDLGSSGSHAGFLGVGYRF